MSDIFRYLHDLEIDKKKEQLNELKSRAEGMSSRRGPEGEGQIDDELEFEISELKDLIFADDDRDPALDYPMFLEKAHQFMQTTNRAYYMNRMKGFLRPFGGEKVDKEPTLGKIVRDHSNTNSIGKGAT